MGKSLLLTGSKVFLYINGVKIGRVHSFQWTAETPKRAIYGLDSNEPYELAPTTTSCRGSIGLWRYLGDGGAEGMGISPPNPEISKESYFSLFMIDEISNNTLFRAEKCSSLNQTWNVPIKGFITGSVSFQAISWSNEVSSQNSTGF